MRLTSRKRKTSFLCDTKNRWDPGSFAPLPPDVRSNLEPQRNRRARDRDGFQHFPKRTWNNNRRGVYTQWWRFEPVIRIDDLWIRNFTVVFDPAEQDLVVPHDMSGFIRDRLGGALDHLRASNGRSIPDRGHEDIVISYDMRGWMLQQLGAAVFSEGENVLVDFNRNVRMTILPINTTFPIVLPSSLMLVKYPVGQPRVAGFCRLRIKFAVYASNRVIIGRILTRALGYVQLDFGSKSSRFPSYPRIQTRPFLESPALIPIFSSPRIIPLSTGRGSKLSFDSVSVPNSHPGLVLTNMNRNC